MNHLLEDVVPNLRRGDGTVAFLACSIPDLGFNGFPINLYDTSVA